MRVMKNMVSKETPKNRNPIAQNLKVNKPKVFKDKTKYDRKSDNGKIGKDSDPGRRWDVT